MFSAGSEMPGLYSAALLSWIGFSVLLSASSIDVCPAGQPFLVLLSQTVECKWKIIPRAIGI